MEKKLKVVVIDDNKDYLFIMETFLSRNGFDVTTAEDGKKGIDCVLEVQPDIVLVDVMMETMFSGFEVCRSIRTNDLLKDTPIIGISGMGQELGMVADTAADNKYFDPDDFMEKPIDKENLLIRIHEVIKKVEIQKKRPKWEKDLEQKYKDTVSR